MMPTLQASRPSRSGTALTAQMMGVGCIPWSPLCRGFLARPWDAKETIRVQSDTYVKTDTECTI